MTDFQDVAASRLREIYIAVELLPVNLDGDSFPVRISSAPRLFTDSTDDPPSATFRAMMFGGPVRNRRLAPISDDGAVAFRGKSLTDLGSVSFDPEAVGGDRAAWRSLRWEGRPYRMWAGSPFGSDGSVFTWGQYAVIGTGTMGKAVADTRSSARIRVPLDGTSTTLDVDSVESFYRGYGSALLLGETQFGSTPSDRAWALQTLTLKWVGRILSMPSSEASLIRHGGRQWGIVVDTAGKLGIVHGGSTRVFSDFTVVLGAELSVAMTMAQGSSAYDFELYNGRTGDLLLAFNGASVPNDAALVFGGVTSSKMEIWEASVLDYVVAAGDIVDLFDSPVTEASEDSGLVEAWKMGDGAGPALGEKGLAEISHAGEYVGTLDGSNAEQFGPSVEGRSRQDGAGYVFNAPLVATDQQFHGFMASDSGLVDYDRVKVDGAPVATDHSITTLASADIAALGDKLLLDDAVAIAEGFSFSKFIPGRSAAVDGQDVTVENAVGYDGTYRVAIDGVAKNGTAMALVDTSTGDPIVFATGDLPSGTVVRTADASLLATVDLTRGAVRFASDPAGIPTIDAVLAGGRNYSVTEAFAAVSGSVPDSTELLWDPPVGYLIKAGEGGRTNASLLDSIVQSALAWRVETADGGHRIGTFQEPSGTPTAAIVGGRPADIDIPLPPIIGRIQKITEQQSVTPNSQLVVSYLKNWQPLQNVIGNVPSSERERLQSEFLIARKRLLSVLIDYPTAVPIDPPWPTLLTTKASADEFLERAEPLLGRRRVWYSATVIGAGFLALPTGALVWLQHDDESLGLTVPVLARLVYAGETLNSDVVKVEMYT